MRILSLAASFLVVVVVSAAGIQDSPHGPDFKINCRVCHSPKGWELDRKIYAFDHNTTLLPLEGQHNSVSCKLCHPTLVFSEAETDCFSCHTDMHKQTVGMDCFRCHTSKSWIVENISDVHRQSRFPLQGPHLMASCQDCHPSASLLQFEPLGVECIDCHMQDYQAAASPNHALGNFSTQCMDCHLMAAITWGGVGFNHTYFPLTQGHAIFDCNQCHTDNDYTNATAECFSCHEIDYNATTNPDHISAGIDNLCMECHTTMPGWKPAIFDHTSFPLTQGHTINECNQCHVSGNYSNVSTECISCHETDYNATTNPNHISAGIDNLCMECHTTMPGWKPAEFPIHDAQFFPIYSGAHGNEWDNCTECHSNPANYSLFTCIDCHEHNRADMDDKHSGEADYEYTSLACLDCHPLGRTD